MNAVAPPWNVNLRSVEPALAVKSESVAVILGLRIKPTCLKSWSVIKSLSVPSNGAWNIIEVDLRSSLESLPIPESGPSTARADAFNVGDPPPVITTLALV